MVYCGKASKGCQHCRTRRIKCDKLRPQCSQCVRAGKQCPGYRDQLSLMFRDENTKVIQKAHAQWGVSGSSDSPSTSSSSPSAAESPLSLVTADGTPIPVGSLSRQSSSVQQALVVTSRIPNAVHPTVFEKGIQFYVDRYILGYPQEPRTSEDIQDVPWMSTPGVADVMVADVMAAVGLSAMSNLTGDKELDIAARQKYGLVLRNTAKSIQNPAALGSLKAMRTIVLLAMFELVQGQSDGLKAHIMGAAALLNSHAPNSSQPTAAFRGLIQLCFSMLIPCYTSCMSLPKPVLEWILLSRQSLPQEDKSAAELLLTLSRFLQLSAGLHGRPLSDSQAGRRELISEVMLIETSLEAWEEQHQTPGSRWGFSTEEADFPPESAFQGRYHVYVNGMWSARVWNHYRWGRMLVSRTILQLDDESRGLDFRDRHLETIRRMANDLLVSVPTHFRHPRLTRAHRDLLDRTCILPRGSAAGIGSAGLPNALMQLEVAGSAPGVPRQYGEWVLGVLETVWSETGMLQAQISAGHLKAHLEKRPRVKIEVVEVKEEHNPAIKTEPLAFRSGQ